MNNPHFVPLPDYPFDKRLDDITLGELGDVTIGELSLSIENMIASLKDRNAKLPIETYEKLCALCDDLGKDSHQAIEKPKNNLKDALDCIFLMLCIVKSVPELFEAYYQPLQLIFEIIQNLG